MDDILSLWPTFSVNFYFSPMSMCWPNVQYTVSQYTVQDYAPGKADQEPAVRRALAGGLGHEHPQCPCDRAADYPHILLKISRITRINNHQAMTLHRYLS